MATEPACETVVVPPVTEVKADEKPVAQEKKAKAPREKRPKASKPSTHPPYLKMVAEAIAALKERTGSSQPAIAKYIEEKYKTGLPANFKKQLAVQIKKFSQSGKLIQVKHSYKLSEALKKPKAVKTPKPKLTEAKPPEAKKETKNKPAAKPKASSSLKRKAVSPAKKVAKKMAPKKTKASLKPKKVNSTKKATRPSMKKAKA